MPARLSSALEAAAAQTMSAAAATFARECFIGSSL